MSKIRNDKKFLKQILQLSGTMYAPTIFVIVLSSCEMHMNINVVKSMFKTG